jgi:predicted ATPase
MITNIKIKGYKSIKDLDLDLKSINILIGANGAGKSNFISFFKLLNNIYEKRLAQYSLRSGLNNLLYYGKKNTTEIKGEISFNTGNAYLFELVPTDDDALFIKVEKSFFNKNSFYTADVKESMIQDSNSFRDKYLRELLNGFKIYHFHDTSYSAPLRSSCDLSDNRILKEDGSNLPAFLYYLQQKHPLNFNRIEKVTKSIIPFFEKFNLSPDNLDQNRIKLEWIEKEHPDTYFNATNLSDGSLRFIALTTLLLQPNLPKVIIIDEPELGLHPQSIIKLAGMIKSVSQKDCQLIISTQSVNLLNDFEPEDIITVDKDGGQSTFKRADRSELEGWLNNYTLGELWTKNVIKGQIL